MKRTIILAHPEARRRALEAVKTAPDDYCVVIGERTRTLDQNAAMWPVLDAFSKQLKWSINKAMVKLSPEEWKDILIAGYRKGTVRIAQGIDSGVVMLGKRTRDYGKREFSGLLDFIHSVAVERGAAV